jgi:serine/threonine protein kinase
VQRSSLEEGQEGARSEVLDLIHEHCEGGNLATALQNGFFRNPDGRVHNNNVMQVVWEMSVGLNYLHSKGAVHGVASTIRCMHCCLT